MDIGPWTEDISGTILCSMERTVMASEFKQRCLALLDLVDETHATVIVTKRGRPVAKVVPIEDPSTPTPSLAGSITFLTDDDEELFSTGAVWDAER